MDFGCRFIKQTEKWSIWRVTDDSWVVNIYFFSETSWRFVDILDAIGGGGGVGGGGGANSVTP